MSVEPGVVDTNVLIYALDGGAPQHGVSLRLLDAARQPSNVLYVLRKRCATAIPSLRIRGGFRTAFLLRSRSGTFGPALVARNSADDGPGRGHRRSPGSPRTPSCDRR